MTNEERDRAMDFVVRNLARLTVSGQRQDARIEKLMRSQEKAERLLKLMIRAGRRERGLRRELEERHDRRYKELLDAQAHTDTRLDALIDIVRRQQNGA